MFKYTVSVCVFLLWAGLIVNGADLTLKNGLFYKNYRIKSVQYNKVQIAFVAADGVLDIAEINIADLPDNIAEALGFDNTSKPATVENNLPETVTAEISEKLKKEFAALTVKDSKAEQLLEEKAAVDLKKKLAVFYSDAEFETVWNSSDGIIAKVTKVNSSAFLKNNDRVFIRSTSRLDKRFRARVYATGCMMQFSSNEMLQVLTFDETSAVKFAMENILSAIKVKAVVPAAQTANTTSQSATVPPVQTVPAVVNNYYYYDDDYDDAIYVIRDGRRYILPYRRPDKRPVVRPVKPVKPAVRPGSKPTVRPEKYPGNKPTVRPESRPANPPPKRSAAKDKLMPPGSDKKINISEQLPEIIAVPAKSARP